MRVEWREGERASGNGSRPSARDERNYIRPDIEEWANRLLALLLLRRRRTQQFAPNWLRAASTEANDGRVNLDLLYIIRQRTLFRPGM